MRRVRTVDPRSRDSRSVVADRLLDGRVAENQSVRAVQLRVLIGWRSLREPIESILCRLRSDRRLVGLVRGGLDTPAADVTEKMALACCASDGNREASRSTLPTTSPSSAVSPLSASKSPPTKPSPSRARSTTSSLAARGSGGSPPSSTAVSSDSTSTSLEGDDARYRVCPRSRYDPFSDRSADPGTGPSITRSSSSEIGTIGSSTFEGYRSV